MNRTDSTREDTASGRASTHSGRGAPRPRTENPEALLRPPSTRGQKTLPLRTLPPGYRPVGGTAYKCCTTRYSRDYKPGWRSSSLRKYLRSSRFAWTERYQDWWRSMQTPRSKPCWTRRSPLVRDEVVAALIAEEDESAAALALKVAISSAVSIRLATTFTAETGGAVNPFQIQALTSLIRSAPYPGLIGWTLTRRAEPSTSQPFTVLQGGPQKMPPHTHWYGRPSRDRQPPGAPRDRESGPVPVEQKRCTRHAQDRSRIHPAFRRRRPPSQDG